MQRMVRANTPLAARQGEEGRLRGPAGLLQRAGDRGRPWAWPCRRPRRGPSSRSSRSQRRRCCCRRRRACSGSSHGSGHHGPAPVVCPQPAHTVLAQRVWRPEHPPATSPDPSACPCANRRRATSEVIRVAAIVAEASRGDAETQQVDEDGGAVGTAERLALPQACRPLIALGCCNSGRLPCAATASGGGNAVRAATWAFDNLPTGGLQVDEGGGASKRGGGTGGRPAEAVQPQRGLRGAAKRGNGKNLDVLGRGA
mmetsp:Transcript_35238/g.92869  ORF Transcript_35238/g.92869 Transcript_35238/m.92869 type:complete len:256 (-) Transcript_35238:132-899(-)